MMKNISYVLAVLAVVFVLPSPARSQDRGFGAGILIGEPTGFSFKGWTSSINAVDAGLAWSFTHETTFHLHADYLWHAFNVFKTTERLPLYYGIGGRIKTGRNEDARFGARMVVGIDYLFRDAPVDIFFEIAPILDFTPSTELQGNAGIGARFWFR